LNFGTPCDIADVIIRAKFCDSGIRGSGVSDIPYFAILYRLSWSPLQQYRHYHATLWWYSILSR